VVRYETGWVAVDPEDNVMWWTAAPKRDHAGGSGPRITELEGMLQAGISVYQVYGRQEDQMTRDERSESRRRHRGE
jgi:hypothetical protein